MLIDIILLLISFYFNKKLINDTIILGVIGLILKKVFSKILPKDLIKRPNHQKCSLDLLYEGFPSSHTLILTYILMCNKNFINILMLLITFIYRYYTGCHTLLQLLGGCMIGIIMYFIKKSIWN